MCVTNTSANLFKQYGAISSVCVPLKCSLKKQVLMLACIWLQNKGFQYKNEEILPMAMCKCNTFTP